MLNCICIECCCFFLYASYTSELAGHCFCNKLTTLPFSDTSDIMSKTLWLTTSINLLSFAPSMFHMRITYIRSIPRDNLNIFTCTRRHLWHQRAYKYIFVSRTQIMHINIHVRTYIYICIHTYTCAYIHIHMHSYTYICMHMQQKARELFPRVRVSVCRARPARILRLAKFLNIYIDIFIYILLGSLCCTGAQLANDLLVRDEVVAFPVLHLRPMSVPGPYQCPFVTCHKMLSP